MCVCVFVCVCVCGVCVCCVVCVCVCGVCVCVKISLVFLNIAEGLFLILWQVNRVIETLKS